MRFIWFSSGIVFILKLGWCSPGRNVSILTILKWTQRTQQLPVGLILDRKTKNPGPTNSFNMTFKPPFPAFRGYRVWQILEIGHFVSVRVVHFVPNCCYLKINLEDEDKWKGRWEWKQIRGRIH